MMTILTIFARKIYQYTNNIVLQSFGSSYFIYFYRSFTKIIKMYDNYGNDVMEQHALKDANNCLNTNIYSFLETYGGQSFNVYLNVVHFFNISVI